MKNIVLIFCFLLSCITYATTYYVSNSGNDTNPGTELQPWQTIQKAANSLLPGDTVLINAGNYPENVIINVIGSPGNMIVFKNYGNDYVTMNPGSFYAWSRSYIRIEGFHIMNMIGEQPGIEFDGYGSYVEIVGNEITGLNATNTAALRVRGFMHHFIIDNNHVHHNNTGNQEGIRIAGYTQDFEITNNEINDNVNIGIDIVGWSQFGKPKNGLIQGNYVHNNNTLTTWASGIYLDGPDSIIVEYNISTGNNMGFQFGCEPAADSSKGNILRYNLSYNNDQYGFSLGGYTGGRVNNCQIYNNVFANNNGEMNFSTNAGHDNIIVNNILYNPTGQSINYLSTPVNTVIDYNCYWTLYGDVPGSNSINADPQFTDVGNYNFSLLAGSPCIDAGSTISNGIPDFNGVIVPLDGNGDGFATPDIGAFEHDLTTNIRENLHNSKSIVYPNPTKEEVYIISGRFNYAELYNVKGEFLKKSNQRKINLKNYSTGLYLIRVYIDSKIELFKIVKIN